VGFISSYLLMAGHQIGHLQACDRKKHSLAFLGTEPEFVHDLILGVC
jgi:hypothetical protein